MSDSAAVAAARSAAPKVPILVAPVVAAAAFMEVLDISIANVSLQHISGDLSASQDESTWVLTSYLVTNAIILPIAGWLASVVGRKRFFLMCIGGFTVSSLACGLAPNLATLIVFRAIQGLAGGGLQPLSQSILADSFPPEKRGTAFALFGMSVVFAPAIGPTLGGVITDAASWRWVFLINVPIGALLIAALSVLISDPPHVVQARVEKLAKGVKLDYPGFFLLALGFGLLQVVLDKGQEDDWFSSPMILWCTIGSVVSLICVVIWELGQDDPIMDLRLLTERNFLMSNLFMIVLGFVLMGSTVLLPILVQSLFGYTATDAGLVMTPGGFVVMALMPICGKLVSKVDSRYLVVIGLLLVASGLWSSSLINLNATYTDILWLRVLQMSGLAFLFIPINTLAYRNLDPSKGPAAASLINVARNLGGSFGISLVVTQIARSSQVHQTVLTSHATNLDPGFVNTVGKLAHVLAAHGGTMAAAMGQATGRVYGMVVQQATMLSFIDGFRDLAVLFVLLVPAVFIMQGGTMLSGKKPPEGAH